MSSHNSLQYSEITFTFHYGQICYSTIGGILNSHLFSLSLKTHISRLTLPWNYNNLIVKLFFFYNWGKFWADVFSIVVCNGPLVLRMSLRRVRVWTSGVSPADRLPALALIVYSLITDWRCARERDWSWSRETIQFQFTSFQTNKKRNHRQMTATQLPVHIRVDALGMSPNSGETADMLNRRMTYMNKLQIKPGSHGNKELLAHQYATWWLS